MPTTPEFHVMTADGFWAGVVVLVWWVRIPLVCYNTVKAVDGVHVSPTAVGM
jgi:hypothetical protein